MISRDLITLHMDRDESTGEWQCPVLNKVFTDRMKIVAIRDCNGSGSSSDNNKNNNEAHVYSYEAYHELNVKPKNYVDLITGKKFRKEDVIVLQDPEDGEFMKRRDVQNFKYIQTMREGGGGKDGSRTDVKRSLTAERIHEKLNKMKREKEDKAASMSKSKDDGNDKNQNKSTPKTNIYTDELLLPLHQTSGLASGSLTSTSLNITLQNSARLATSEEIITSQCEQLRQLKQKGLVRLYTNMGCMDIELHCDIVPRTCMNFLLLASRGDYSKSPFHRSIRNFMIQGGKRPKTKGEKRSADSSSSYWDKPFPDEFDDRLLHTKRGVVSMANSGPNTNARQFFITYKSCPHLNRKHSVFGTVIGGWDVLTRLEEVPTDEDDCPVHDVFIEEVEILENPINMALELEEKRIEKKKEEKRREASIRAGGGGVAAEKNGDVEITVVKESEAEEEPAIGKYMKSLNKKKKSKERTLDDGDIGGEVETMKSRLPPPPKKTTFGDFSGW